MLAPRATILRRRREAANPLILGASLLVLLIILYFIDFVITRVAPKLRREDESMAFYLRVVAAEVAAPLVAAFALVRFYPAVAFLVGLVVLNMSLLVVFGLAVTSLFHAIGYSSSPSVLRVVFFMYAHQAFTFQLYYFYGAYHSVTYIELEDETNDADGEGGLQIP